MLDNVSGLNFDAVTGALDVGIIVLDSRGRVVVWNDWIAAATRVSKEAALGHDLRVLFPSLRDSRLPAAIEDALQIGTSSILTHTLNRLLPLRGEDGRVLLHNIALRPIASGGSTYCLVQISDVTVSVTRERILRERQNARYHAIVGSVPDAIITTDLDRTIRWMNGAAESVFGYGANELLGQRVDILLDQANDLLPGSAGEGVEVKATEIQVAGRRKNGETAAFEVSFGRWKAEDRVFVTTVWRDVTERLNAEAALRESEGRYRALLEAVPQLVWTSRADGSSDYFNPQWQTYTGAVEQDHLGWGWLKAVHESDRAALEAAWKSSLATGSVFDADARLYRANGSCRWFKFRSIPVWASGGKASRWFGTATEITDLVEARETLRRSNDDLEALVAERTQEREVVLKQLHEFAENGEHRAAHRRRRT